MIQTQIIHPPLTRIKPKRDARPFVEGDDPHSDPEGYSHKVATTSSTRPPAGNLRRYLSSWESITDNNFVLKV